MQALRKGWTDSAQDGAFTGEMQQIISGLEQQIRELRAQNEELRGQIPPGPSKETS